MAESPINIEICGEGKSVEGIDEEKQAFLEVGFLIAIVHVVDEDIE